jgi:CheY-like chemotaxis protein
MIHDFANSSSTPRILVVEDDPIIRTIHQQVLASLGCQVDCVSRGQAAIRQLHYDMVLLDMGLPDISGANVIKAARTREIQRKPLPFIVVTAHDKENEATYLALGADRVFRKPLARGQLHSLLVEYGLLENKK